MKNRLLGLPQKRILHKSAIPSSYLPPGGNSFEVPSTLRRWCAKFTCHPGVLHNVFTLMSNCTENLSELDKYCVLSFDEMHIDSKVVYDCGIDQILGPHSKVQVVLLRGLTSKWKQPVYFIWIQP